MNQPAQQSSVTDMLGDLDAGVFAQKMERALSDVALGVVTTGKSGKVTITFDIKQIATSNQVSVKHKRAFVRPTNNGKASEENTIETPMHVGTRGKLTLFPETQPDMFKSGDPTPSADHTPAEKA